MNLSFSTRGWNHLPWEDQVRDAEEYHFQGIEIYNLTRTPQWTERSSPFHQYHLNETLRDLKEKHLSVSCLDTPIDLSAEQISPDEFRGLFHAAGVLQTRYVEDREDQVRQNLEIILAQIQNTDQCLLIKTTGIYADTGRLRALLDSFAQDELGALWDMHHPFRDYGETPDVTIRNLGAYVKHVHLRDSDDQGEYNLIGEGTLPIRDMMRALNSIDYDGFLSMEWKPEWMPDLQIREVILPYFINYMRRFDNPRGKRKVLYPNHDGTGRYIWKKEPFMSLSFYMGLAVPIAAPIIVLYNLTNINITERIREIATIKVLGFYHTETGSYVFRENFVLTLMGAFLGLPLGILLHSFVISQIKVDMVSFKTIIFGRSFAFAIVIVIGFSLVVDLLMRRKLDRIDMAESMKAVE